MRNTNSLIWNNRAQPRRRPTRIIGCPTCPRWFDAWEGHLHGETLFVCPSCHAARAADADRTTTTQPKGN